jgi:hypothetical protein
MGTAHATIFPRRTCRKRRAIWGSTSLPFALMLFSGLWLGLVPLVSAQAASFRYELLSLLPDDFAVCVVMHDLRGQANRWEHSDWLKTFRDSPLGKTLLQAPELKQLAQFEKELKKHFDLDWRSLRDDVLGDTVLLAYSPGDDNRPEDERGLFLLHARAPERLAALIQQLNDVQKKSGELKSLTALQYKDETYYRRVQGSKTQYYYVAGALLGVSSREELIQGVLDKKPRMTKDHPWTGRFRRAGADQAFLLLCVNPRAVEPDFIKNSAKDEGAPGYWQALEGIFVTLSIRDEAEVRVAIQAKLESLPAWTRPAFSQTTVPSTLWQHFPESSIATLAVQTDFANLVDGLKRLLSVKDRETMESRLRQTLGGFLERDILKEVLPNIGPDWGVCVLPAKNPSHVPLALFAIAVQPGPKDSPIDQSLIGAVRICAGATVLAYNLHHADLLHLKSLKEGSVEVTYLSNDKLFPPGLQPACALKEGFLLFASSPEAIAHFHKNESRGSQPKESPVFRLSTRELAKLLKQQQEQIVSKLRQRQQMSETEARKNLDSVIALLELFERVTLSQQAEAGQASWTVRLAPAGSSKTGD